MIQQSISPFSRNVVKRQNKGVDRTWRADSHMSHHTLQIEDGRSG
ncbi:unnamed protein product [Leptidea sinapis]|uniref:Uncharacterized protein n=1 Tax=Leptidea sinapis TaxID=189913 RepID=A0A5E4QU75_9NEOP|nr:unnamed protein product [Leptidea sinapis]